MESIQSNTDKLSSDITRRNLKLKILFSKVGDNFRIIGNPNHPCVIMNENVVLSAWAHNFYINFQDRPLKGKMLFSIKLNNQDTYSEQDIEKIKNWLKNESYHRPAFKIGMNCGYNVLSDEIIHTIYLAGYNYDNAETKTGRYPVFANRCPKIYFTREKAEEVMKELEKDGFEVYLDVDKIYRPTLK